MRFRKACRRAGNMQAKARMTEPATQLPMEVQAALGAVDATVEAHDAKDLAAALDQLARANLTAQQRLAVAARVRGCADRATTPELEARLRSLQGQLLTESGDIDSARKALHRCIELAHSEQIHDLHWKAETVLGIAEAMSGNLPQGMTHLNRAVDAATRAGDLRAVGRTLINIGNTQNEMGLSIEAAETAQRAIDIARDVGDEAAVVSATVLLGISHMNAGDFDRAEATWQTALAPAEALGARRTVGNLHANIAVGRHRRGYLQSARQSFQLAARHFEQAGARHESAAVLASLGTVLVEEGEFEQALPPLQRSIDAHKDGGDKADAAHGLCTLAAALTGLGRLDEATTALQQADALCHDDSPVDLRFALVGSQSRLALARGDFARALKDADAHRRLARVLTEVSEEAAALALSAAAYEGMGDTAEAESAAEQALELLAGAGLVPGTLQLELLVLLARVNLRAGRMADAQAMVERAHDAADNLPLFHESEGAKVRGLASELRRLEKAASRS